MLLDAPAAAIAEAAADDVDGVALTPEFVLIAIVTVERFERSHTSKARPLIAFSTTITKPFCVFCRCNVLIDDNIVCGIPYDEY